MVAHASGSANGTGSLADKLRPFLRNISISVVGMFAAGAAQAYFAVNALKNRWGVPYFGITVCM